MKKLLFFVAVTGFAILTGNALFAAQLKLRFVGSIYTDTDGVPLRTPAGVTIAGDKLLVADSGGKRVLTYNFVNGVATPDKNIPLAKNFPIMVQQAQNGDFLVLDGLERQVLILGQNGKQKGTLKVKGADGRIVPRSLKSNPDGSLLLLDIFSARVLVVDETGNLQRQLPFPKEYGAFSDTLMDAQKNVFLLDSVAGKIYRAAFDSDSFSLWSDGLKEFTNFPTSFASDGHGNLLLIDKYGSGLAIIGPDGKFSGRKLSMGWTDGQIYYPSQISISGEGQVFIADTENHRIQHFAIEE